MKTITLEEALKRATKGPLNLHHNPIITGPNDEAICRMMNGGNRIMENDEVAMNMVLLAHCYNHFEEVVGALQEYVSFDKCTCYELDGATCQCCLAESILTKATTITLP